jgi:hypothetical protein
MLEHENVGAIEVIVPSAQHLEMIVDMGRVTVSPKTGMLLTSPVAAR